jgi:hypothetical protein
VNKKQQKNFVNAGPWAMAPTTPMAQHRKSFCAAFFKKRPLRVTAGEKTRGDRVDRSGAWPHDPCTLPVVA